jgi:hypothetical protein
MPKSEKLRFGFCDKPIEGKKELQTTKYGRKTILSCPHCNAILAAYYA